MNIGKYIFAQVIDFIPRYQFDKLVKKYKGDWHAKDLSCYNQLLHLLFGQITGCVSIRDICLCPEAHGSSIYHLGIRKSVNQSNLCRANEKRDYRIYEGLGMYLIGIVRPMYSNTKVAEITIDNVLYALDSTTISTSIVLAAWALGKYSKGAVKMHTLLDLRGSIPANIHITDGKWHGSNELDEIVPETFEKIKECIMQSAVVGFDESGCYCNKRLDWAWIAQTVYYLNEVDDKQQWSRRIENILQQAIHERNEHPQDIIPKESWLKRLDDILKQSVTSLGKDFQRLKNGLIKCRDYMFNFLEDPLIPSDNNDSERGIRKLKIKLKNSGTFRSELGSDVFLELHSIVETAKKHDLSPYKAIRALLGNTDSYAMAFAE